MPGGIAGENSGSPDSQPPAANHSNRRRRRSFLHNQVRSMVGSLKLVGEGRWTASDLKSRSRRMTAPPAARSPPRTVSISSRSITERAPGPSPRVPHYFRRPKGRFFRHASRCRALVSLALRLPHRQALRPGLGACHHWRASPPFRNGGGPGRGFRLHDSVVRRASSTR